MRFRGHRGISNFNRGKRSQTLLTSAVPVHSGEDAEPAWCQSLTALPFVDDGAARCAVGALLECVIVLLVCGLTPRPCGWRAPALRPSHAPVRAPRATSRRAYSAAAVVFASRMRFASADQEFQRIRASLLLKVSSCPPIAMYVGQQFHVRGARPLRSRRYVKRRPLCHRRRPRTDYSDTWTNASGPPLSRPTSRSPYPPARESVAPLPCRSSRRPPLFPTGSRQYNGSRLP